jgi:hypothetical protein
MGGFVTAEELFVFEAELLLIFTATEGAVFAMACDGKDLLSLTLGVIVLKTSQVAYLGQGIVEC